MNIPAMFTMVGFAMPDEARIELLVRGGLDRQALVLIVRELLGFVLYMHHQMPWTFEQLQNELSNMEEDITKGYEEANTGTNAAGRNSRKMLQKLKKLRKFQKAVDSLMLAVETTILSTPTISSIMLLLGSNVARPQVMYRLHLCFQSLDAPSMDRTGVKQLSRKMIRELISNDVGEPLPGPTKLFLLIRASAETMPTEHFLPKRGYACKTSKVNQISIYLIQNEGGLHRTSDIEPEKDTIWFQCRQSFKGLISKVID